MVTKSKVQSKPGVYCIKSTDSNKIYIGSSKNIRVRRNSHKSSINKEDYKHGVPSIVKLGKSENLFFEVLEYCNKDAKKIRTYTIFSKKIKQTYFTI